MTDLILDDNDPNKVDASPTKAFFISMLVRDLTLTRAIVDLVDNSVDGAARLNPDDYSAYWVNIDVSQDLFRISDNCGGIPVETARNYAFRFGRPTLAPTPTPPGVAIAPTPISQFGVGMKRTIFKLGDHFRIESTTPTSHFVVDEKVSDWLHKKEWSFQFAPLEEGPQEGPVGTIVEVKALLPDTLESFGLANFVGTLVQELQDAHPRALSKGLTIKVNNLPVEPHQLELYQSSTILPAYVDNLLREEGRADIRVQIVAGVASRDLDRGGWYVFCNGRLVLGGDQTGLTGWGDNNGKTLPKYHTDFAYFRGYVLFESSDASLLPWTTTKTGVDTDSRVYQSTKLEMIHATKQVLKFLRDLERERDAAARDDGLARPLHAAWEEASRKPIPYYEVSRRGGFTFVTAPVAPQKPTKRRIQYECAIADVEKAMKALDVTTPKEVGERTFNYFFKRECS